MESIANAFERLGDLLPSSIACDDDLLALEKKVFRALLGRAERTFEDMNRESDDWKKVIDKRLIRADHVVEMARVRLAGVEKLKKLQQNKIVELRAHLQQLQ